jgi:crotonobetainyl-CoA:carnitine CoA-transferase CaiB-like acyl-CoA transferase
MASALLRANEHVQLELADMDPGPEPPSLSPGGAPILTTADGQRITIAGDPVASHSFGLYCRLMGRPELADDPRFAAVEARKEHRADLVAELREWAGRFADPEALEAECAKVRMAMGVVRSVEEAAASEWAAARGAIAEVGDRAGGTIRVPDAAWRFSDAEAGVAGDPAWRGEHNRDVFGELGIDDEELDRLEADGVLSSRPPRRS